LLASAGRIIVMSKQNPIWFTAREGAKNIGYLEATPIGVDAVTGFTEYRVQVDEEVFVLLHNPERGIWHLLYRAIEQSIYGDDPDAEIID